MARRPPANHGDASGRRLWRNLDEFHDTAESRRLASVEFPGASRAGGELDRRVLLRLLASVGLVGLNACGDPDESALPYVDAPEFVIPGRPAWYATAVTVAGIAQPVLAKTHAGRPVKLEGNPDHPATRGASDCFLQAALLGLYDPERSQAPRYLGRPADWAAFDADMAGRVTELDRRGGRGFRLLTGTVTSPTLARQIDALLARWPGARWHVFEPVDDDGRREAARQVFAQPCDLDLLLDRAETIVSLDDDFLGPGPRQAVLARRWADRRVAYQAGDGESRLFVAEPTPSATGTLAEDRLIVAAPRVAVLANAIAHAMGLLPETGVGLTGAERRFVDRARAALDEARGRALLVVGARQPREVQALGLRISAALGALGTTLGLSRPIAVSPPDGAQSFPVLVEDMKAGRVSALAMLDTNPAYAAPAGLEFAAAAERVPFRLHAGLHDDETAILSHWHLPLAHELESWSDARAADGTISIVQPLVRPFYAVRPLHAIVDSLTGGRRGDHEIVRSTWQAAWRDEFEDHWRAALVQGFVPGSAEPLATTPVAAGRPMPAGTEASAGLTAIFQPDPSVWDGRFAGNAWLQETPKPLTKVTWGNVVLVSPALAAERGLASGDEVRVTLGDREVAGAAWIMPGQEDKTVVLYFGYGRRRGGRAADGAGYDASALLDRDVPGWISGVTIAPTGRRLVVATTQMHQAMDGFDFVRVVDRPDGSPEKAGAAGPSFYPDRRWDSPSWGMAIDLDLCIGCNACVVACVAENNVPVVGKDQVVQGREMHWLRVDRYHEGDPAAPRSYFQPVPCMHCEQAPCEMGCPVNAAVHSADGLNLQVYNRCIGTRTCSSYCPYKVRRFNWHDYTGADPAPVRAMRNPDVTVRTRGVMEKCTYCVQRTSEARIAAKIAGRPIGAVETACQQACPTRAISFGDITDPASMVSRRKASTRNYSLLEEANTVPRTTYLARIGRPVGDVEDEAG